MMASSACLAPASAKTIVPSFFRIERAGRIADIRPEAANHLVKARRAGGNSLTSQRVRVDRRHAK
jgi:hypothetical protein